MSQGELIDILDICMYLENIDVSRLVHKYTRYIYLEKLISQGELIDILDICI